MPFTITDRDNLLNDPKGFLGNAFVMVPESCYKPDLKGHPDLLTLEELPDTQAYKEVDLGTDFGVERIRAFNLKKADQHSTVVFPAYIVEYEKGGTPTTVLGTVGSLAFTATMNGCTFGIGTQRSPSSSVVVTHSNSSGFGSNRTGQYDDQRSNVSSALGGTGALLDPVDYRNGSTNATTFGYRETGTLWKFAYIAWRPIGGGRFKTYGVRDIDTTQHRF